MKHTIGFILLFSFIFLFEVAFQYVGVTFYIFDLAEGGAVARAVLRAFFVAVFWMAGFVTMEFVCRILPRVVRYCSVTVLAILFIGYMFVAVIDANIVYYSGLHLSPVALDHATGAGEVIQSAAFVPTIVAFFSLSALFIFSVIAFMRAATRSGRFTLFLARLIVLVCAFGISWWLAVLGNTPEAVIAAAFLDRYAPQSSQTTLTPALRAKLQRFGLRYNPSALVVTEKKHVYRPSNTQKFLPDRLLRDQPNILIIFLESFSARLTSVYSTRFHGLTPGLEAMAGDSDTTIFKGYYNSSTPTETGIVSQLCSFLPPTGHGEQSAQAAVASHQLLCLPEMLKQNGYASASYITAVEKEYASKDEIFRRMDVDTVLGTQELAQHIQGAPRSWGYSDHQMFPAVWELMQRTARPFLTLFSTIDSHPTFNLSKDATPYGDGQNTVLNSFHSTDDAFRIFWNQFRASPRADDTIVIAVADHAVFPSGNVKDLFSEDRDRLTFYDETAFLMYVPDTVLPKEVNIVSSGLDFAPTLLHVLGINTANTFEGHSIFDDRSQYPNVLGMHELGLYANELRVDGTR
ncbi:LTA synthase family protein, partial [Candidatus Uhrbacteria bacterium]|nr:LTA synthase family protein [Candidatus Uhrbacteria bacterium]